VKGFTITGREQPKNELLGVQDTTKMMEVMNDLVRRKNVKIILGLYKNHLS
jgi:hypothetical protein